MIRIYLPEILKDKKEVKLNHESIKYLKKVMRIDNLTQFKIFDGKEEYFANLNECRAILGRKTGDAITNGVKIAICSIKQSRMEWLVEKATEIGVDEIFILQSQHSNKKNQNFQRLGKISIEAAEQCGRISLPKINENIMKLDDFLGIIGQEWQYADFREDEKNEIGKCTIIGPEGGWNEAERKKLSQKHKSVNLGPNILRAETAAIVALAKGRL